MFKNTFSSVSTKFQSLESEDRFTAQILCVCEGGFLIFQF